MRFLPRRPTRDRRAAASAFPEVGEGGPVTGSPGAGPSGALGSAAPPSRGDLVITIPPHLSYASTKGGRGGVPRTVSLRVLGVAMSPLGGEAVTLISARAGIQFDGGPVQPCETRITQYVPDHRSLPPGYRYPPIVDSGRGLEIECTFHVDAHTSPMSPRAVVQPEAARAVGLTLVDDRRHSYLVGDVDFGPVVVAHDQ